MWPFRKKPSEQPKEPLIAPLEGAIELDEEERDAVERGASYSIRDRIEAAGREFPKHAFDGLVASDLFLLARRRLRAGNLHGAASTAMKAIGIGPSAEPHCWLLLARAHAEYGDIRAAKGLLRQAEAEQRRVETRQEENEDHAASWRTEVSEVRRLIKGDR